MFRRLAPGNTVHALEFLEAFGPLLPDDPTQKLTTHKGEHAIVRLNEFWGHHMRFCLIAGLWESLKDKTALRSAWKRVYYKRYEEVSLPGAPRPSTAGQLRMLEEDWKPFFHRLSSDFATKNFDEWVGTTPLDRLREEALLFVLGELNLNATDATMRWQRGWEPTGTKFRVLVSTHHLLAMIWQFFGWDTAEGSWRRCPHCQRFFYPRRKDQFYCTPRQQALASKRDYAQRWRDEHRRRENARHRMGKRSYKARVKLLGTERENGKKGRRTPKANKGGKNQ
jgi:hypothetical protein